MFCGKCGAQIADGSQFCAACGARSQSAAGRPPDAVLSAPLAPAYPAPPQTSGKAVASLILGFLFFFPLTAIAAIVLGHLSLADIRKSAGRLAGRGIAIGGLVLGYLGIAIIPVVLIVAAIAIPNLLRARMAADEASAIGSLRDINAAATTYLATYGNGYPPDLQTLSGTGVANCNHAGLIDGLMAIGVRNGYTFSYQPTAGTSGSGTLPKTPGQGCTKIGAGGYTVTAEPVELGTTGQASYFTDSTGVIRVQRIGTATADSPPLN